MSEGHDAEQQRSLVMDSDLSLRFPHPHWNCLVIWTKESKSTTLIMSPLQTTGYRKGQSALAAPTVLSCILLTVSHTIASTPYSEHLPLHLFHSFAVRARDEVCSPLPFALSLVCWQYPNLNKPPLSSPELFVSKTNEVISSRCGSWESGENREAEKTVAIFRSFLFKLQVKMSVLSLFRDENSACLAFKDVMSSLKLQGIWDSLMLRLYQHFTIPAQWLYTSAENSFLSSLLREGQQSHRLSPFSGADMHFWWCFYSSTVNCVLKISITLSSPYLTAFFPSHRQISSCFLLPAGRHSWINNFPLHTWLGLLKLWESFCLKMTRFWQQAAEKGELIQRRERRKEW